jgi:GDP-4-dehydro-6-deoxy-D-mannose reductase
MKVLVTGGTGFVGKHVVKSFREVGHEVTIGTRGICTEKDSVQFFLDNSSWMEMILNKLNVDAIVHLSGRASVGSSFNNPFETYQSNVIDTVNLLKLVSEKFKNIRLVIAGSSEVYMPSSEELNEDSILGSVSPYGFTKIFIDCFSRILASKDDLRIVVTRPFNTIGPGQSDVYVLSSFAKQIAEMKLGVRERVLKVGNLEISRDFVDVRDVAIAYLKLVEGNDIGEAYNICSSNCYKLVDCLNEMFEIEKMKDIKIEVDQARMRPADVKSFVGTYKKIKNKYGWSPRIPIDQTLCDIITYWEKKLSGAKI